MGKAVWKPAGGFWIKKTVLLEHFHLNVVFQIVKWVWQCKSS